MSVSRDGESECRCDSILENTSDSNREEDQSKVDEGGSCSAALVAHIFFFSELEWGVLLPGLERRGTVRVGYSNSYKARYELVHVNVPYIRILVHTTSKRII